MNVYEIRQEMENLVDPETGEVGDYDRFAELALERDVKVDNAAAWVINLKAEADALQAQIDVLTKRKRAIVNRANSLSEYLRRFLGGEKFKSPRVSISYRKSSSVEIEDENGLVMWALENMPDLLLVKDPEPSKQRITEALKGGVEIPYCRMAEKTNMTIK